MGRTPKTDKELIDHLQKENRELKLRMRFQNVIDWRSDMYELSNYHNDLLLYLIKQLSPKEEKPEVKEIKQEKPKVEPKKEEKKEEEDDDDDDYELDDEDDDDEDDIPIKRR